MKHFVKPFIILALCLLILPIFIYCSSKQEVETVDIYSIKVISPNGDEEYKRESTLTIEWSSVTSKDQNQTNDSDTSNNNRPNQNNNVDYASNDASNQNNNNNTSNLSFWGIGRDSTILNNDNTFTKNPSANFGIFSLINSVIDFNNFSSNKLKLSQLNCGDTGNLFLIIGGVAAGVGLLVVIIVLIYNGIKKSPSKDSYNRIDIELFKGGVFKSTIADKRANKGTFEWKIPPNFELGNDYTIKISSSYNKEVFDSSDNTFSIISQDLTTDDDNNNTDTDNGINDNENPNNNNSNTSYNSNTNKITLSMLPKYMPHYIYFDLKNISAETSTVPDNKRRIINKMIDHYVIDNAKPSDKECLADLSKGTLIEKLDTFSEIEEVIMGVGSLKYESEDRATIMLLKVSDTQTIIDRLDDDTRYYRTIVNGYEVFKSTKSSTLIFSGKVMGITTPNLEDMLIESYTTQNGYVTENERNSDLVWCRFSGIELINALSELGINELKINPAEFRMIDFSLKKNSDALSLEISINTTTNSIATNYASILNNSIIMFRNYLIDEALSGITMHKKVAIGELIDSIIIEEANNVIYTQIDISNEIIDSILY